MMSFLQLLKTGDEVVVAHPSYGTGADRLTIERIHRASKERILVSGMAFRRSTGDEVCKEWRKCRLLEATPETKTQVVEAKQRENLIYKLESVRWKTLDLEVLKRVDEVLASAASGDADAAQENAVSALNK